MPVKSKRDEEKWEKAKQLAAERGEAGNYAYIMGIYKKMDPDYFKGEGIRSLHTLVRTGRDAMSMTERFRAISEVTAYVMMTGPRGGRFYYDDGGRRHYGELPAGRRRGGAEAPKPRARKTRAEHDREWQEARGFPGDTRTMGRVLWDMFGDRAPGPKELGEMFSAQGIQAELISADASAGGSWRGATPSFRLQYQVFDQDGTRIGSMSRKFSMRNGKPHVYHGYFALNENAQGGGRCGAMFGQALKTYQKMGVKSVGVSASLTTGPYAWARFGFQPDEHQMRNIRSDFKKFLQRPPVNITEDQAERFVQKHGRDLYTLSAATLQVQQLDPTGKPEYKTIKVGKNFLLFHHDGEPRDWNGVADLTDPKVVERWEAQSAKGIGKREKALREGKQNARSAPSTEMQEARAAERDLYTPHGRRRWQQQQQRAAEIARQRRSPAPTPRPPGPPIPAAARAPADARASATRPNVPPVRPRPGGAIPGGPRPAPAPRAPVRPRAGGALPGGPQPVSPQAADLIRQGQRQVARAQAGGPTRPQTPEQRAKEHGTTVAQEKRIDRLVDPKVQAELLRRREARALARHRGASPPEFVPIREYEKQLRDSERSRILRRPS